MTDRVTVLGTLGLGKLGIGALGLGTLCLALAPDATPSIAPRLGLVWALVLPAIATLWWRSPVLHMAAATLFALAAEHLLFSPGLPRGHDLLAHSWGLWSFFQAMHAGDLTPQWLHHLSLGLPLPLFYSPATYYSLTPLYWAGFSVTQILKGAFVLHALVGTLGMYFLARRWTASSRAGLAAAAAYAFAPYRLLDAHYRMALGESAALALLPLFFGLVFDPTTWSRRRVAATAVLTGMLILTHPLSVLTTGVAAVVWQGVEMVRLGVHRSSRRLAARAAAAVLGLALAGTFVVPLAARVSSISLGRAVNHPETEQLNMSLQGLRLSQPFHRLAWRGVLNPEPQGNPRDTDTREMPPYLGWGLIACSLLAGGIGLGKKETLEVPVAILAIASVALTFTPSAVLLAHIPLLSNLQFPWRFLGPATCAGALAVAFVATQLVKARRRAFQALGLVALTMLMIVDGLPFTGAGQWVPAHQELDHLAHFYMEDPDCGERWGCWKVEPIPGPPPLRIYGGFLPPGDFGIDVAHVKPGFGEYLNPLALRRVLDTAEEGTWAGLGTGWVGDTRRPGVRVLNAAPYAGWRGGGSNEVTTLQFRRGGGSIEVDLPGTEGTLVILEQYQPGWEATLGGEATLDDGILNSATVTSTGGGMIQVTVPPGAAMPSASRRLDLRFRVTGWDVWLGRAASLLALAVSVLLGLTRNRVRVLEETKTGAST